MIQTVVLIAYKITTTFIAFILKLISEGRHLHVPSRQAAAGGDRIWKGEIIFEIKKMSSDGPKSLDYGHYFAFFYQNPSLEIIVCDFRYIETELILHFKLCKYALTLVFLPD